MSKNKSDAKRRRLPVVLSIAAAVLIVLFAAFALYIGNYSHASDAAVAFTEGGSGYTVETVDGNTVFRPDKPLAGLIFYPGGKVEHTAYAPLMAGLAYKGVLCVLVKMPFRLAVFDMNAADGIKDDFPEVNSWYIGGHSLGGAMAASYVGKHCDEFDGLVLLGAYSTSDLSKSGLDIISIYGSEDRVLNKDKYNQNLGNLPDNFTELVIDGGCHSYFGDYGAQKGDGEPCITRDEQIKQTVDAVTDFILAG